MVEYVRGTLLEEKSVLPDLAKKQKKIQKLFIIFNSRI
jgi:hypothetical protein